MNFPFFCHNISLSGCVWNPPTAQITASTIWHEQTAVWDIAKHSYYGIWVDGKKIIANVGDRKVIVSYDLGETWSEKIDALPMSPVDTAVPKTRYLIPRQFSYGNGSWRALFCDSNPDIGNAETFVGWSSDGLNWSYNSITVPSGGNAGKIQGVKNGGYNLANAVWDGNGLTKGGAWRGNLSGEDDPYPPPGTVNSCVVARYDNEGNPISFAPATDILSVGGEPNHNDYRLLKLSDGYFRARWTGSVMLGDWVKSDLTVRELSYRFSGSTQKYTVSIDTVLQPISATTAFKWERGGLSTSTAPIITFTGLVSQGEARFDWNGHHWLAMNFDTGTDRTWNTSYNTSANAGQAGWTPGPQVIVDNAVTTVGNYPAQCNLYRADDGWWVGWYIDRTNFLMRIIKFKYGDYVGNCW